MIKNSQKLSSFALFSSFLISSITGEAANQKKNEINVLLITADDLNCSSVNLFGGKVNNLTPNIDALAHSGIYFQYSHVTTGVSQVSRGALATGLYPHNSGIDGFYNTTKEIPTIQEILIDNGFQIGIIGKVKHSSPKENTKWDFSAEIGGGRDYNKYAAALKSFILKSQKEGKPFYFMANSHDPHRPWEGSEDAAIKFPSHDFPYPSTIYQPKDVEIPGFLPDILKVREEITMYTNSVKRLDDFVGAILKVLDETGVADNTMVIFLSDNGMSIPFSKTNCYLHSTRTPWIVRFPGVVTPGSIDKKHFISGIDYLPTVLEAVGIPIPSNLDGKSFYSVLRGKNQSGRKNVFTQFTETSGKKRYPMRCVQDKKYGYIFNAWSVDKRVFKNESQIGISWSAMKEAALTTPSIAERNRFFEYRTVEEFYDFEKDPDALNNLIENPLYKRTIEKYRKKLEINLRKTNDPILEAYLNRNDSHFLSQYMKEQDKLVKNRMTNMIEIPNKKKTVSGKTLKKTNKK